ncbi:hypothetical protein JI747_013975 [Chryseobacterium sp. RG1]|uniref:Uncharacterized protein n=1 Tax=Chryseobacterium tagetis TaxID=2801334 RepID=A0ABS8A4D2_9FLAO|nr:hypothetical protein [Chryseobacterium tagetis]MCA6068297.1 hypothetical protein [Chryseobacterium tagetis]
MEKENIITINQTHEETEFNWIIKRYLPNFKDGKSTIIGVQFPWKRIFDSDKNLEETLQTIANLFNDFAKGDFFKSINYTPQYRDIFLLNASLFSSYYWIEFIFTKDKWNLKTKRYSWEKESFIFSLGNNRNHDFIVSKIDYKVSSESYDMEKWLENFNNTKFKLPIYLNEESFEKSNYIFHYGTSEGFRADFRHRSVDLLIDEDFDYFLRINYNEYPETLRKEMHYIQQGQTPQKIAFQLLKVISENNEYQAYGRSLRGISVKNFMFKINNKAHLSRIFVVMEDKNSDQKRLEKLKDIIENWIDKIVEFQKQN